MKRIINGIPMWVSQHHAGKGKRLLFWYGQYRDPTTGKLKSHYIGKHLPPESSSLADPLSPFPEDGLFRCCRCGGHACTDPLFVLCHECYEWIRPMGPTT